MEFPREGCFFLNLTSLTERVYFFNPFIMQFRRSERVNKEKKQLKCSPESLPGTSYELQ